MVLCWLSCAIRPQPAIVAAAHGPGGQVDGINTAGIIVLMWRLSLQVLSDAAVSLELPLVFQIPEELSNLITKVMVI